MNSLIIINEAPYGNEHCYNALRIAHALLTLDDAQVDVFLLADGVVAARGGQKTPPGYYNIERMLKQVISGDGRVLACETCMTVRGLGRDELMTGAETSNLTELADLIAAADRVLTF